MEEIKQMANPINNAEKYGGRESSKDIRKLLLEEPDGEIVPERDGFKFTVNKPMNGPQDPNPPHRPEVFENNPNDDEDGGDVLDDE